MGGESAIIGINRCQRNSRVVCSENGRIFIRFFKILLHLPRSTYEQPVGVGSLFYDFVEKGNGVVRWQGKVLFPRQTRFGEIEPHLPESASVKWIEGLTVKGADDADMSRAGAASVFVRVVGKLRAFSLGDMNHFFLH